MPQNFSSNGMGGSSGADLRIPFTDSLRTLLLSKKYFNIETKRQCASNLSTANAVGGANKDFRIIGTSESLLGWDAVRYIGLNYETANSVQGFTCNFAPTANMNTPNVPTGAWTTFTFSGAGFINLVNTANAFVATIVVSDWMTGANIQSVARDDGGSLPMWMVTQHNPFGPGTFTYSFEGQSSTAFDTDAITQGRRFYKMFQSGIDGVTTPANFTQTAESNNCNPFILQFRVRGQIISMMVCGDSIAGGSLSTSNMLSPGFMAAINSSSGNMPVQYIGAGYANRVSLDSLTEVKNFISTVNPQVCVFQPYSPNDGAFSAAILATQMRQCEDFIAHAYANDTLPIITTPTPDNSDSLAVSTLKISMQGQILQLRSRGILVADWWNTVAAFPGNNGTTGWGWKTGLFGDTKHPNDAGTQLMGTGDLSNELRKIIAGNTRTLW